MIDNIYLLSLILTKSDQKYQTHVLQLRLGQSHSEDDVHKMLHPPDRRWSSIGCDGPDWEDAPWLGAPIKTRAEADPIGGSPRQADLRGGSPLGLEQ